MGDWQWLKNRFGFASKDLDTLIKTVCKNLVIKQKITKAIS